MVIGLKSIKMANQNKSVDNRLIIIMGFAMIGIVAVVTLVIAFFNNLIANG